MATCARCSISTDAPAPAWCKQCELLFDRWLRAHATDIVWQALVGTVLVSGIAVGLPLLGIGPLVGAAGAFVGVGALYGLARLTRRRRRRQFLQGPLPRAYLPPPK